MRVCANLTNVLHTSCKLLSKSAHSETHLRLHSSVISQGYLRAAERVETRAAGIGAKALARLSAIATHNTIFMTTPMLYIGGLKGLCERRYTEDYKLNHGFFVHNT
jgi:hypothetical protein